VGISKVAVPGELARALEAAFGHDNSVVVEEAVHCREIEICVMGNRTLQVSPPGEVIPFNEFYDYEDKYILGKTRFEIPARLEPGQISEIRDLALRAFRCLHLNGWARVDFLLDRDTGDWYVNEINTIPGFTTISMFPKLWIEAGISFRDLVTRLIHLGFEYYREGQR
jgi:D-alanine-D-alanine ligase